MGQRSAVAAGGRSAPRSPARREASARSLRKSIAVAEESAEASNRDHCSEFLLVSCSEFPLGNAFRKWRAAASRRQLDSRRAQHFFCQNLRFTGHARSSGRQISTTPPLVKNLQVAPDGVQFRDKEVNVTSNRNADYRLPTSRGEIFAAAIFAFPSSNLHNAFL